MYLTSTLFGTRRVPIWAAAGPLARLVADGRASALGALHSAGMPACQEFRVADTGSSGGQRNAGGSR